MAWGGSALDPATLLSPEEVARLTGLSTKAVYRAVRRGELPAAKLCGRLRVAPEDLRAWFEASIVRIEAPKERVAMPSPAAPVRATLEALRTIERRAEA